MCFPLACCGWMLLSTIFAFGNAMRTEVNVTTVYSTVYYYKGDSAISCKYNLLNYTEIIRVELQKNNHVFCTYMRVKSWKNQTCDDHSRFIWIPETSEILFELSNLQINDIGIYNCTVRQLAPPPEKTLWVEITKVNVFVRPVLLMSCEKRPRGSPVILCSALGFYPAALEQHWRRDEEIINSSYSHKDENYSTNANGLFARKFYLELPPQRTNEKIFFCWVNHSSLNRPLVANLSSTACFDQRDVTLTVAVASVVSAVPIVFVIIVVIYQFYRSAQLQSAVDVSVNPEPVCHTVIYSSLGDHHPNPCSRSPSINLSQLHAD